MVRSGGAWEGRLKRQKASSCVRGPEKGVRE